MCRLGGLVVLGALWLPSTVVVAQGQSDAIARLLAQADTLAERGRSRQAWRQLRRASRRAGAEDGRPAIALGELLPSEPRDPEAPWPDRAIEARDALEAFLEAAPNAEDAPQAARLRSWATALAGDHQAAIERAAGAIGLQDRESSALLRRLATLAVRRDDLHAARRALLAAHRAWPQGSDILSELGAVELALGRPGDAVERFGRILGRDPTDLDARRDLAGALVAAGRPEAAVELLSSATSAHPGEVDLWLELAWAAIEARAPETAERAAHRAIDALSADDGRGHTALGTALAARGQTEAAAAAFDEALRRDPDDLRARQGRDTLRAAGERSDRSAAEDLAAP